MGDPKRAGPLPDQGVRGGLDPVLSNIIYLLNADYSLLILLFILSLLIYVNSEKGSKRKVIKLANGFRKPDADF